jgi:hypothetical protein
MINIKQIAISRYQQLKSNRGTICTPVEMVAAGGKKLKKYKHIKID